MHLRAESDLATSETLAQLKRDLESIVRPADAVVFSGGLPEELMDVCLDILKAVDRKGARIVVDTSGPQLRQIIEGGAVHLIKPNLEELQECLDKSVKEDVNSIIGAAQKLGDRIDTVVVSLGEQGAVAVTKDRAVHCKVDPRQYDTIRTVGCGDYLLAGILGRLQSKNNILEALKTGTQVAAARAWGFTETMEWSDVQQRIDIEIIDRKL
jgi:fructose-1-phosphate kinase PfkB-like protein